MARHTFDNIVNVPGRGFFTRNAAWSEHTLEVDGIATPYPPERMIIHLSIWDPKAIRIGYPVGKSYWFDTPEEREEYRAMLAEERAIKRAQRERSEVAVEEFKRYPVENQEQMLRMYKKYLQKKGLL